MSQVELEIMLMISVDIALIYSMEQQPDLEAGFAHCAKWISLDFT